MQELGAANETWLSLCGENRECRTLLPSPGGCPGCTTEQLWCDLALLCCHRHKLVIDVLQEARRGVLEDFQVNCMQGHQAGMHI